LRTISATTAWAWGPIASSARCGARVARRSSISTAPDPQAQSSVNFFLNEDMFKMFFGSFTINVVDPQIVFNDGFYDLVDVRIPEGTLLKPQFPAALSGRTHALGVSSICSVPCWAWARRSRCSTPQVSPIHRICSIPATTPAGQGRRVVPAVPDRLRRHSRTARR
jgi:hypothetical protein